MSNLPGKITDPHLSAEEPLTFRRCLRFILQALLVTFGGAAFIQIVGSFSLFYFGEFTDLVCAILYATFILTCILTAEGIPSSPKDDTSAEK